MYNFIFFEITGLDPIYFNKFVSDLYKYKVDNGYKSLDWFRIKIICSIYSYLILYMDRILDNINKQIISYLLFPFKEGDYTKKLNDLFDKMGDQEFLNVMKINENISRKKEEIDSKIEKIKFCRNIINNIEKDNKTGIAHKKSRILRNSN